MSKGPKRPGADMPTDVVVPFRRKPPANENKADDRPDYNWLRFRLRNGFVGMFPIVHRDVDRVWRVVQEHQSYGAYIVFETTARVVALNLRHVVAVQFDGHLKRGLQPGLMPDFEGLELMFGGSAGFVFVEVDPDELSLSDLEDKGKREEYDEEEMAELTQLANLIFYCDSCDEDTDYIERLEDMWASTIWLRLNDVAFISIPRDYLVAEE